MATFDMTTTEGLRIACHEAEASFAQEPDNVERMASFLQEVHETPVEERQSETFLRRVWDDNPLGGVGNGDYDVRAALSDDSFRRDFHGLTNSSLPGTPAERATRLDGIIAETLNLVQPFVPPNRSGLHHKPITKTMRAFAALFPNDFTALFYEPMRLRLLRDAFGGSVGVKRPATADRRILDKLEDAIGGVDRSDWSKVALRMRLPLVLLEIHERPDHPSRSWPDHSTLRVDPGGGKTHLRPGNGGIASPRPMGE